MVAIWNRRQRPAKPFEQLARNPGFDIAPCGFRIGRLVQPRPAPAEPIGLIRLVIGASDKFFFKLGNKTGGVCLGPICVNYALFNEARGVDRANRRMCFDIGVHQRLGEAWLITFIMAKAAVAPHVDHDIAVECLTIFDGELTRESHSFRIIAVDMENWRLNTLRHIGRVGRAPRELRAGGKAHLVVDDEVDATARIIAANARKSEAFPNDPLARKSGVAVEQDWQHLNMVREIITHRLVRADFAKDDWINRFQMRRVGDERHMHFDAVKFTVSAGAEMIFNVT